VGTGNINQATTANSNPFFIDRIYNCITEKEKLPNFITVDFYETGNCCEVVNTLNSIYANGFENLNTRIQIYPQPAKDYIIIQGAGITDIQIYDLNGKKLIIRSEQFSDEIDCGP
jgi:hypothetical protein